MARSTLLSKLVSISRLVNETKNQQSISFEDAINLNSDRRDFIKKAASIGATMVLGMSTMEAAALTYANKRIAIIGAGLAGLRCAYELNKVGIASTIYEANPSRLGGRCYSNHTSFPGNVVENGGELIDTDHTDIQKLAAELGLVFDDCDAYSDALGLGELYWVNGHVYTYSQAFADFSLMANQLNQDIAHAPFPQTYNNYTQRGYELDYMSVADYIAAYAPGGLNSDFGKVLSAAYVIEYGAELTAQSAYGLVNLLGYSNKTTSGNKQFYWFGTSDERFHIRGGNDQLISGMNAKLPVGSIKQGFYLTAIALNADNTYKLTFSTSAGDVSVTADHVVMAIPFSILRSSVNFSMAGFDTLKKTAINTMPMGQNCKFQLGFTRRIWQDSQRSGETYSDQGYQNTWEPTRGQNTTTSVLNNYVGGNTALNYSNASNLNNLAKSVLSQLENLFPGITNTWNGNVLLNNWPKNPYSLGAYGYYAPGNYTTFVGYEGVRQGNCHFCGEHTSIISQGFLNGATETGLRCAKEIMNDLKNA